MSHRSSTSVSAPVRRVTTSLIALGVLASCTSGDGDDVGVPGIDSTTTVVTTTPATTTPPTVEAPTTTEELVASTPPPTAPPATTAPPTAPETTATVPTTSTTAPAGPFLRRGDEGPEVAILQLKLQTAGFLDPGYTEGVFDGATNDAVIAFQGQYGLLVDGVVGPETDRALTAAALSVNPEQD